MNLNINQFKENFLANKEALLDKNLLLSDMSTLMEYYCNSPNECPSHLIKFLPEDKSDKNSLIDFTLAYLGKIIDKKLGYSTTEDGWVKLFAI